MKKVYAIIKLLRENGDDAKVMFFKILIDMMFINSALQGATGLF